MKTMNRREFLKDLGIGTAVLGAFGLSYCTKKKDTNESKDIDTLESLVADAKNYYYKEAYKIEWKVDERGISHRDTEKENKKKETAINKYESVEEKAKSLLGTEKNPEKIKEYAGHLIDSYYNIGNLLGDIEFPSGKVPASHRRKILDVSLDAHRNINKYKVHEDYKARLFLRIANQLERLKIRGSIRDREVYIEYLCRAHIEAAETNNRIINTTTDKLKRLMQTDYRSLIEIEMTQPYFAKHKNLIAELK